MANDVKWAILLVEGKSMKFHLTSKSYFELPWQGDAAIGVNFQSTVGKRRGCRQRGTFLIPKEMSGLQIFLMLSGCRVTCAILGSYLSLGSTHNISRYNDRVNSMFNSLIYESPRTIIFIGTGSGIPPGGSCSRKLSS